MLLRHVNVGCNVFSCRSLLLKLWKSMKPPGSQSQHVLVATSLESDTQMSPVTWHQGKDIITRWSLIYLLCIIGPLRPSKNSGRIYKKTITILSRFAMPFALLYTHIKCLIVGLSMIHYFYYTALHMVYYTLHLLSHCMVKINNNFKFCSVYILKLLLARYNKHARCKNAKGLERWLWNQNGWSRPVLQ